MHEQHIRILNKIAQNVKIKIGSTIKNANNIAQYSIPADSGSNNGTDEHYLETFKRNLNESVGFFNKSISFEHISYTKEKNDSSDITVEEIKFGQPSIHIGDSVYAELKDTTLYYHLAISAENLISNLLRFDHFEKFALFDKKRALFETYPTGSSINFDSLTIAGKTISTIESREIRYGGVLHIAYFRPLRINAEQQWMLTGFISAEKMAGQKFSLSPLFTIILLLIILLIFLSIPFIKLKIMHNRERLALKEVVFSLISVAFIVGITIWLTITGYTYWGIDKPRIEEELKTLSGSIQNELTDEVDRIIGFLDEDSLKKHNINLLVPEPDSYDKKILLSIENIFRIDPNGVQLDGKMSISDKPTPVIPVRDRNYFQKAREPDLLCSEGFTTRDSTCFYLESIISYNTGKQLAALSVPVEPGGDSKYPEAEVIATTGRLHSIINTVLPFGYGYAILNEQGDVLFHSDPNRNLQENFFEELASSEQLEANMFARTSDVIKTDYHDQSTLLHVAPISIQFASHDTTSSVSAAEKANLIHDWPLTLVTFYDSSLLSLKYLEIYTLHITIFVIIIIGLFLLFFIGFVIEKWGTSFWKKAQHEPLFYLKNFAPRKDKNSSYRAVVYSFWILLVIFFITAATFAIYSVRPGIFLVTSVLLVCLQYWILRYFLSDQKSFKFRFARIFESVVLGFGIFLYVKFLVDSLFLAIVFYAISLLLPIGLPVIYGNLHRFFRNLDHLIKKLEQFFLNREKTLKQFGRSWSNRHSRDHLYLDRYFKIVLLGTLSFSLFLTFSIYIACYLQETEVVQKYSLVEFSKAVSQHRSDEREYFYSLVREDVSQKKSLMELANLHIEDDNGIYWGLTRDSVRTAPGCRAPYLFYPHPYQLRVKSKISRAHIFNDPDLEKDTLRHYTDWKCSDKYLFSTILYSANKDGLAIAEPDTLSLALRRASLNPRREEFLTLLIVLLLVMVAAGNSMVKQVVRELFVLPAPENYQFKDRDFKNNLGSFKKLLSESKHLYVTTMPVQFREIHQRIKQDKELEYDLVSWEEILSDKIEYTDLSASETGKTLIVTNFDLTGEEDKSKALNHLKKAMQKRNVILISTYDPLDLLYRIGHRKDKNAEREHDILTGLLAEFETYYFPLTKDTIEKHQAKEQQQDILVKEANIYYEIWNSLSPDEQYVMYDLATDGLVNTQNKPIINRLYKKGLIGENGNHFNFENTRYITSLEIFHDRFTKFVSNLVETDKLKELEKEINATGSWRQYRTPLLITLTAILIFIFITQQETYGEVVGVLGSIAASTPLLLKLFNSVFSLGGKSGGGGQN